MMLAEKEITTYACFIVFYRNPILYLVSHALFYQKNLKSRQCDRTYLFRPADDLRDFSKADPAGHDRGARAARGARRGRGCACRGIAAAGLARAAP